MTFTEFQDIVAAQRPDEGRVLAVPVYSRRSADLLTPVAAFLAMREPGSFGFLFESVEQGKQLGRYSFLGKRPYKVFEARGERTFLHRPPGRIGGDGAPHEVEPLSGAIYDELKRALGNIEQARVPELPRFTGGAVGFMGYDTARLHETLTIGPPNSLGLPDAVWGLYDHLTAFDHVRHQLLFIATVFVDGDTDLEEAFADAQERLVEMEEDAVHHPTEPGEPVSLSSEELSSNMEPEAFEEMVLTAQKHIVEGDIFQVVLSQRFEMAFEGDRFNLYRALRQVNPSPYLFFLDVDGLDDTESECTLIGSSPEVLARVEPRGPNRSAELLPIAGTRPRGATPTLDADHEADLLVDAKEQAEHLMLVDLGRNDLGRLARAGSVHVESYAEVERFSHVMHLVSRVTGALEDDTEALDVLAACFPAGTVSGAPKVRAMEIIDQLEPVRRGPYAGGVGYLGFDGALDTCIAIRTMVVTGQTAYLQAGAGIVVDSDPDNEFKETKAKAAALHAALLAASSELL